MTKKSTPRVGTAGGFSHELIKNSGDFAAILNFAGWDGAKHVGSHYGGATPRMKKTHCYTDRVATRIFG